MTELRILTGRDDPALSWGPSATARVLLSGGVQQELGVRETGSPTLPACPWKEGPCAEKGGQLLEARKGRELFLPESRQFLPTP